MPWEYIELQLCRDIYHCTPSELAGENWRTVSLHLRLLQTEAEIREAERKVKG